MKSKIILKKDDRHTINLIFDLVKSNKGEVLEYSDSFITIEGDKMLIDKIEKNRLIFNKLETKV